jgi:hypothetical protein
MKKARSAPLTERPLWRLRPDTAKQPALLATKGLSADVRFRPDQSILSVA